MFVSPVTLGLVTVCTILLNEVVTVTRDPGVWYDEAFWVAALDLNLVSSIVVPMLPLPASTVITTDFESAYSLIARLCHCTISALVNCFMSPEV